jgi:hypothetical protein
VGVVFYILIAIDGKHIRTLTWANKAIACFGGQDQLDPFTVLTAFNGKLLFDLPTHPNSSHAPYRYQRQKL